MEWLLQAWHHVDFNPHLSEPHSLIAISKMIGIDLLLSLDNALVIALVARGLPLHQQRKGIIYGTAAAIALRLIFGLLGAVALEIWFVRALGGIWLVWVAIGLLFDEADDDDGDVKARTLFSAMITIGLADMGMSLDNVLALAALAEGNVAFIWIGVLLSIPMVMFGAEVARMIVNKYPFLVWIGAVFLGYVAGKLLGEDPALHHYLPQLKNYWQFTGYLAAFVVLITGWVNKIEESKKVHDEHPI